MERKETVLVTGGSGFIASYCILVLLNSGYKVKTTLRSLKKTGLVKQILSHFSFAFKKEFGATATALYEQRAKIHS